MKHWFLFILFNLPTPEGEPHWLEDHWVQPFSSEETCEMQAHFFRQQLHPGDRDRIFYCLPQTPGQNKPNES